MLTKQKIWVLVLIIIFRLCLVTLPSFKIDMTDWQAWAQRLVEVNPTHFYSPTYFSDYFPGYLYMLWFLGKSFIFLFPHLSIFSLGFEFYLKFFTNIFDFATAYYIYKIISNYKKSSAFLITAMYLLNPALAFNSSVWGQVDGILAFFLVFSAYNLLELKKISRFNISFALSVLVKPQGLAVFPVFLVHLLANFKATKYFSLVLIPILLILFSLPFFLRDPILGLLHLFQKSADTYPYTSMFSYNLWSFAGWWIPDSTKFLSLTYQVWGIIIYFISLIFILTPLIIKRSYKNNFLVYFASALASFAFFLFLTRIHQRYLFHFFAFLLIVSLIKNSMKLKVLYIILSIVHFLNLYFVYYYYNFVYSNPSYASSIIYKFLNSNYNYFTLFNLVCFVVLIYLYYKSSFTEKYA